MLEKRKQTFKKCIKYYHEMTLVDYFKKPLFLGALGFVQSFFENNSMTKTKNSRVKRKMRSQLVLEIGTVNQLPLCKKSRTMLQRCEYKKIYLTSTVI